MTIKKALKIYFSLIWQHNIGVRCGNRKEQSENECRTAIAEQSFHYKHKIYTLLPSDAFCRRSRLNFHCLSLVKRVDDKASERIEILLSTLRWQWRLFKGKMQISPKTCVRLHDAMP